MVCVLLKVILIIATITVVVSIRPKPPGNLGIVIPNLSGWGWSSSSTTTETPPETTTGWTETTTEETTTTAPAETTTSPPETGWTTPPGWSNQDGWTESVPVDIEMVAESAVIGEGEAAASHGSQTVVTGDASNPAFVQIQTGSYATLGQGSGVLQTSGVSSAGDTNTFHGVDSYNLGDAGEYFGGTLSGNGVNTNSAGGAFILGQGGMGQGSFTFNSAALSPLQNQNIIG